MQQTSGGHIVYIANEKNEAEIRPVTVGDWLGNDWIINQGLKKGDRVIVDGFMKHGAGMPVKVVTPEQMKAAQQTKPAETK